MTPQRRVVDLEPAYLLHSRAYRDTSAILEALSENYGRVGIVGRGVRGPRSRLRGTLQPFAPLLLSWSGRGDLGTLTGAEMQGRARVLTGARVAAGFYLNELLLRLLRREDPHPGVFHAYAMALADLDRGGDAETPLRLFEKRLLEALGYGLTLDHDESGDPVDADAWYLVRPETLPVRVPAYREEGTVVRGSSLLALSAEIALERDAAADAKRVMRTVLGPHLGSRPLKSRELYRQLSTPRAGPPPEE